MDMQARGLISLDALDSTSGASAICRYSLGAKCEARILAAQLPDEATYIAIIWAADRPVILGEMKKTNRGWEAQGEFESECVDAAFIAIKSAGDISAVLAGKAMGAKVDMNQALFRVRLMSEKKKNPRGADTHSSVRAAITAKVVEEPYKGHAEKKSEAAPALERFVASASERSIAPRRTPAAAEAKPEPKPAAKPEAKPAAKRRLHELLRRESPDHRRSIGNPFPGRYPGAKWELVTYPGAQHPHYLAGHWRRGSQELLVSCVPGEKAPHPPRWLDGFAEHQTSRWGQGYWIGVTDYHTGKPAR